MNIHRKLCALACTALLLIPLAACSKGTQNSSMEKAQSAADSSQQTQIVGKVTSIVGNQVTLAIGTLNSSEEKGAARRSNAGEKNNADRGKVISAASSAAAEDSSSATSSQSGSESSSGLITLTGETQTFLIPVGLTLSSARLGTGVSAKDGSGANGAAAENENAPARPDDASGNQMSGLRGGNAAAQLSQRTQDFSDITPGMILQITEKTLSDGTQQIVSVAVLSE
ncbi:MAG: Lipoprotein [Oscillospiraceae bacterium]|jgi:hypothetical protein